MFKHSALFILLGTYVYAITDFAPVEIGEKTGLTSKLVLSSDFRRGNTDKDEYDAGYKIQYDTNISASWIQASYAYAQTNDTTIENAKNLHARHLFKYDEQWVPEVYAQIESDDFKQLKQRSLSGGGLRYKFITTKDYGSAYISAGAYYENVQYDNEEIDKRESQVRISSYLAYKYAISDRLELAYLGYYQPKVNDTSDFYTSNSIELKVNIVKQIWINFIFDYDFDSDPAQGVDRKDVRQKTSLIFEF